MTHKREGRRLVRMLNTIKAAPDTECICVLGAAYHPTSTPGVQSVRRFYLRLPTGAERWMRYEFGPDIVSEVSRHDLEDASTWRGPVSAAKSLFTVFPQLSVLACAGFVVRAETRDLGRSHSNAVQALRSVGAGAYADTVSAAYAPTSGGAR